MGTPDILGTYGTFSFFTSRAVAFAGKDAVRRHRLSGRRRRTASCAARSTARTTRSCSEPEKIARRLHRATSIATSRSRQARGRRRGAAAARSASGATGCRCSFDARCRRRSLHGDVPVLPEAARPVLRALRQPAQPRPAGAGDADLDAGRVRRRAGARRPAASTRRACPRTPRRSRPACSRATSSWRRRGMAGDENRRQYRYVLDRFDGGLLFYYFGNVDQVSHMMWRALDPEHPAYDAGERRAVRGRHRGALRRARRDRRRHARRGSGPDDLLVVMSDHGFTSWRRAFHLNSWLRDNGYLALRRSGRAATTRALRQRRLVAHARLRARAERPLPQPRRAARATGIVDAGRARGAGATRSRRSCWPTIDPATGAAGVTQGLSPRARSTS